MSGLLGAIRFTGTMPQRAKIYRSHRMKSGKSALGQTRTADLQFRKLCYKGMGSNLVFLNKLATPYYFLPNILSSWSSDSFIITGLPWGHEYGSRVANRLSISVRISSRVSF